MSVGGVGHREVSGGILFDCCACYSLSKDPNIMLA